MTGHDRGNIGLTTRLVGLAVAGGGLLLYLFMGWYEAAKSRGWAPLWWALVLGGMGLVWSVIVRWQVVGPLLGLSLRRQKPWDSSTTIDRNLPGELRVLDESIQEILRDAHEHSEGEMRSARAFDTLAQSLAGQWRTLKEETTSQAQTLREGMAEISLLGDQLKRMDETIQRLQERMDGVGDDAGELSELLKERRAACRDLGSAMASIMNRSREFLGALEDVDGQVQSFERSVEAAASGVRSVSESAREVTGTSRNLEKSTRSLHETASEGEKVLREVNTHARGTTQAVLESANSVRDLGSRSEEIGAVVEVIESIADETNLLALNAAIIAAQAGEHGRSFAVVAEEIRELAERTSSSTKEVADLVKGVQDGIDQAAQSIHESANRVHQSANLAEQAGEFWSRVLAGAEQNVNLAEAIALSSSDQASGTEKLGTVVENLGSALDGIARKVRVERNGEDRLGEETGQLLSLLERLESTDPDVCHRVGRVKKESSAAVHTLAELKSQSSGGSGASGVLQRRLDAVWNHVQQQIRLLDLQRDTLRMKPAAGAKEDASGDAEEDMPVAVRGTNL
jgi:methyl-accepting chemotaxis protein